MLPSWGWFIVMAKWDRSRILVLGLSAWAKGPKNHTDEKGKQKHQHPTVCELT